MTEATRSMLEQHFDTAFAAHDGIARLRELILTLAMQGKLVDQDPNDPLELQEFTFWLEAECLDPDWRLQLYSKILDLGRGKDVGLSLQVRALNKLLPDHLALVVECFAKITDAMDQSTQMYVSADEAKPILKAGLPADDPQVRENAECVRENLLRLGRFDYLDTE